MKDKGNTGTSRQLIRGQLVRVSINRVPVLGRKLCDDVENEVGLVSKVIDERVSKGLELRLVLLERPLNLGLDLGQSIFDMMHENLLDVRDTH